MGVIERVSWAEIVTAVWAKPPYPFVGEIGRVCWAEIVTAVWAKPPYLFVGEVGKVSVGRLGALKNKGDWGDPIAFAVECFS